MSKVKEEVFLNIPYDPRFTRLYLAYITALSAVGLVPTAAVGVPGSRRLDRIMSLLEKCSYSIHDLSRVQLDRTAPRNKSLSDLDGTDPYIHDGTIRGVMREVCNAFVSAGSQPTVPAMMKIYRELHRSQPQILRNAGASSLFTARVFSDMCPRPRPCEVSIWRDDFHS